MSVTAPTQEDTTKLTEEIARLRNEMMAVTPMIQSINKTVDNIDRIVFGEPRAGLPGMLVRIANIEQELRTTNMTLHSWQPEIKKVSILEAAMDTQHERNIKADTRMQTILWLATFLGVTNVSGLLALIGILTGILP